MISLDTNIIQSALNPMDINHARALQALDHYAEQPFCLSPIVRSEIRASKAWPAINAWLKAQSVKVIWDMPSSVWDAAGVAFQEYARLRRGGQLPRRIVADFLIGAHATHHELAVLTFDDTVFKSVFPNLKLLSR